MTGGGGAVPIRAEQTVASARWMRLFSSLRSASRAGESVLPA